MAKARIWNGTAWVVLDSQVAEDAKKLGGQLPDYYATKQSVTDLTVVVDANKTAAQTDLANAVAAQATKDTSQDTAITGVTTRVTTIENSIGTANGLATLDSNGLVPVSQLPNVVKEAKVVADIAARDAIADKFEGLHALVLDATGDATVISGAAEYVYDGTQFVKVSEAESMDLTLQWDNIQGRPVTTPANIDKAVADLYALQTSVGSSTIGADLAAEIARAQAAEASLQTNIDNEVIRAQAAETTNATAITSETSRAQAAEGTLQTAITTEATRAQGVETALDGRVTTLEGRVNVIMSTTAPTDTTALWVDLN